MREIATLLLFVWAFLAGGCSTVTVGASMHSPLDAPEVTLQNPTAFLRGEAHCGEFVCYCQHESGLFYYEKGYGYNSCGVGKSWDIQ